ILPPNNGSGVAHGFTISDVLPANAGLAWTISPANSACAITGTTTKTLTCGGTTTDLAASPGPGNTFSVHISSPTTVATCTSGAVSNRATFTTSNDGSGASSASPTITTDIVVNCANITLTKTADSGSVNSGDTIGYTILATNNGSGLGHGLHT